MSKNILILSSSPRRGGNSDTLCDEFMRGAIESGNQVEKIFLRDKNIHPCTGCSVCSRYKKPCPQKEGIRAGWTLIIRRGQHLVKDTLRIRINPASTMSSIPYSCSICCRAASNACCVGYASFDSTAVGTRFCAARVRA